MKTRTQVAVSVASILVVYALAVVSTQTYRDSKQTVDTSWRASAFNRQVTDCIEKYEPVARVYDFEKMSDRDTAQLAEITGVREATIRACVR